AQKGGVGAGAGRVIFASEQTTGGGNYAENRKNRVGDVESVNLLGFGDAGHADGVRLIDADVNERAVLFAVDEIVGGGHVEVGNVEARGGMPDADERFGMGIGKGFEEDAFED